MRTDKANCLSVCLSALKLLSFSFSRPPEPELGGGLTHPTTETCRSLEGTTVQRKGSALYASTHKAYEVQRPQKTITVRQEYF